MNMLRKLLFPFSILYDLVTRIRNLMYDKGWLSSSEFDIPVLCIGNLNVGGTGKSPMVEYVLRLLKEHDKVAVLSRGYGRKTKGFRMVTISDSPAQVGDEPLQIKQKFPNITVAVCENRSEGIKELQQLVSPNMVVLDDAFQHRGVSPSFSVLLTAYDDLYVDDLILPAGNLRESRSGARRADVVVVTKSPAEITEEQRRLITKKISLANNQQLFFATIAYADTIHSEKDKLSLAALQDQEILLVTGIAKPAPLLKHLRGLEIKSTHLQYKDHHLFSDTDINTILAKADGKKLILTTEKDFVRLLPLMKEAPLYYLPIAHRFVEEGDVFDRLIVSQRKKA